MFISKCRMCSGSSFYKFLDLRQMPPADQFLFAEQLKGAEESYPLEVVVCEACSLVQLNYVVPPEILYCNDYPYESSTTKAGRSHWNEFAETTVRLLDLETRRIWSSTSAAMSAFCCRCSMTRARACSASIRPPISPRSPTATASRRSRPFSTRKAPIVIIARKGTAQVITGTNVFAHIDDLHDLMTASGSIAQRQGRLDHRGALLSPSCCTAWNTTRSITSTCHICR